MFLDWESVGIHRHRKLSVFVGALPLYIDLIAEYSVSVSHLTDYVYVSRNAMHSVSLTLRNSTVPHTLQKHVGRSKIADSSMPIDLLCEALHCIYISLVLSEQALELC